MKIALDAGHGGRDPGNTQGGMREKETALDLALRTGHYVRLLSEHAVRTEFSREDDSTVTITKRVALAKSVGADLLLSIHTNSGNSSARGAEVIVSKSGYYKNMSHALGERILDRLEACGFANRGVKPDMKPWIRYNQLGILSGVNKQMAAVLVECGFASNERDAAMLRDKNAREVIAIQLAAACLEILGVTPRMDIV